MDGDYRKVSLILTPLMASDTNEKQKQPNKKKKGNDGGPPEKKKKKHKTRFRVRLVIGAQFEGAKNTPDTNTGWIPSARLFPDRCNNKVAEVAGQETSSDGTPVYNASQCLIDGNEGILGIMDVAQNLVFTARVSERS
jgi:hypothetical protein